MTRPSQLRTRIFLDSADPEETKKALDILGFLDGQTTNPTLLAKSPQVKDVFETQGKLEADKLVDLYKESVQEISKLIPKGSVSIEIYADLETTSEEMLLQAHNMWTWVPNAHIKFPTNIQGLTAMSEFVKQGGRANMTLVFDQLQAGAVYNASLGASKGQVFVSPFIGRLNDTGLNGLDLVRNCVKLYSSGDNHVEVLAASTRTVTDIVTCIELGVDIITAPLKLLAEWAGLGFPIGLDRDFAGDQKLQPIPFNSDAINYNWKLIPENDLLRAGIMKFANDWNSLIAVHTKD